MSPVHAHSDSPSPLRLQDIRPVDSSVPRDVTPRRRRSRPFPDVSTDEDGDAPSNDSTRRERPGDSSKSEPPIVEHHVPAQGRHVDLVVQSSMTPARVLLRDGLPTRQALPGGVCTARRRGAHAAPRAGSITHAQA